MTPSGTSAFRRTAGPAGRPACTDSTGRRVQNSVRRRHRTACLPCACGGRWCARSRPAPRRSLKLIEKRHGVRLVPEELPLDDPATYDIFSKALTSGIFQFESSGMQDILRRYHPTRIEDLTALNALYRPGPLQGGMVDDFIDRKHGRKAVVYDLPELKALLEETYGVIVYQEQVMQISNVLAGYSLGEADILRRAMGKK